jgi:hypothetical protein
MQQEIDAQAPARDVRLLGVNSVGAEGGNPAMTDGRTLPWLQDVPAQDVWTLWDVTWRDVVILDEDNQVVGVYNLTDHDLSLPANYDELKAMLVQATTP